MLCIYCNERESSAREHYLPQCLGRFENFEPLLGKLCEACNSAIGGELEREFCRRSPEAVLRSFSWIRGQRRGGKKRRRAPVYQPQKIGGKHLFFMAFDPNTGTDILWQTDEKPGAGKEISQLVVLDADGNAMRHIPIPTAITTPRELGEVLKKELALEGTDAIPLMRVIAASGDEKRVQGLFPSPITMQRREGGRIGPQLFAGEITSAYFRALAKIGFHYALKYIPAIAGSEEAFRPLREFIRHGTGDAGRFLSPRESAANSSTHRGHCLIAEANPNGRIFVEMQFFIGCDVALPRWLLNVGPNPSRLAVSQASAHFFAYIREADDRSKGGEVVRLVS